jgi:hypothetical protein
MKDCLRQAVYIALRPLLNDTDVVAAPRGDWPAFPCATIIYDDLIEIQNCTIFVLHKGLFTSLQAFRKLNSSISPKNGSGFLRTKCS